MRIELHCHLDGCVRLDTLVELSEAQQVPMPARVRDVAVAPEHPRDLMAYIACVDVAVSVMQTPEALRRIARELVYDWRFDKVGYGEVRFAPHLHTRNGMSLVEVLDAVHEGLSQGSAETGVRTGLILCCLRHQDARASMEVAELAAAHRERVDALDLAGDESLPALPHYPAFALAREVGLPFTVHAGEAGGADNVREAIDALGARRVGHGVRAATDTQLVDRLAREGVTLEMCPRSNAQTGAVVAMRHHPAKRLLRAGVPVTINTDARTVSDTTLDIEFKSLTEAVEWTDSDTSLASFHAAAAAFGTASRPDAASPADAP